MLVVLLRQTSLHTQYTVGETPPWQRNDRLCRFNLKRQQLMRKGDRKSNPVPLRIAQSGGNAIQTEPSPLSGVGGVSAVG